MTICGVTTKLAAIIAAFLRGWWKVIVGQGLYQTLSWVYDTPLWMTIEAAFGLRGVVVMMVSAIAINFCTLFYYRSKEVSWLGWDRGIKLIPIINRIKWEKLKKIAILVFLSVFQNSFIATAYMRHDREKNGLTAKDYITFLASSMISVSYWAIRNGIIVETVRVLINKVF